MKNKVLKNFDDAIVDIDGNLFKFEQLTDREQLIYVDGFKGGVKQVTPFLSAVLIGFTLIFILMVALYLKNEGIILK